MAPFPLLSVLARVADRLVGGTGLIMLVLQLPDKILTSRAVLSILAESHINGSHQWCLSTCLIHNLLKLNSLQHNLPAKAAMFDKTWPEQATISLTNLII